MTAAAATDHLAKHDNSRSESSNFLGNTVSVTSTLIDSRKNSCFSNGLNNNNPYDSSEEYETQEKHETAAAAAVPEYKQRLSPTASSGRKYNPDPKSQNPSSYDAPERSSKSEKGETATEDPYTEKTYISIPSKNLDSSHQQVFSSEVNDKTAASSEVLQRSVAFGLSDVISDDSVQLELPDSSWSYRCCQDDNSSPTTLFSRGEGDADYSGETNVAEHKSGIKPLEKHTKDIFVTHL